MDSKIIKKENWKWAVISERYYLLWLIKRVFWGIFLPIQTLFRRKFLVRTVLWFVFSVGFSLIGTIINIIKFAVFNIPKMPNAPETIGEKYVCPSIWIVRLVHFIHFQSYWQLQFFILCLNVLSNMNGIIHIYV